mmetsp:Transcript_91422/g.295776  ORF Transcript_91422/g.295776 Transcript_91422/m.295776 type:complete len:395 (+) Transcript_91422:111-1295(+)
MAGRTSRVVGARIGAGSARHLDGELERRLDAILAVEILEQVEQGRSHALMLDDRVGGPMPQRRRRHPAGEDLLAERVALGPPAQPVAALNQRLEGARRGVHGVVPGVGLVVQPELSPGPVDGPSQGSILRMGRVCVAYQALAELCPGQVRRRPLQGVPCDGPSRCRVHVSHRQIKAIDDVELIDESSIETAPELDLAIANLQGRPFIVHLLDAQVKSLHGVPGIADQVARKSIIPRQPEGVLEPSQSVRLHHLILGALVERFCSDAAIVPVDDALFQKFLCRERPLIDHLDPFLCKATADEVTHRQSVGSWLQIKEAAISREVLLRSSRSGLAAPIHHEWRRQPRCCYCSCCCCCYCCSCCCLTLPNRRPQQQAVIRQRRLHRRRLHQHRRLWS